ncbi:phospholipid:diacylglycerol acyltransferase 1 isoform X1 [Cryptomeria japonica]|uniref:phospholipid:diacylglycerol acyltransferase 1 isoform X1 n=1 Tax=Cryptomeria japonica TaxID=3369 RepID=UPI0025AD28BF|nr:phospholipid:diacylglycerol acyltransferase 1 isoform X1 [Cryptomeria japonica]
MMAIFRRRKLADVLCPQIVENTHKENDKEKGSDEELRTNSANFESTHKQNGTEKRPEEVLKCNFQNFDDNKQNGTGKGSDEVLRSTSPKFDSTNKHKGTEKRTVEVTGDKIKSANEFKKWGCMDSCCWTVGYVCTTWWLLLVLYNALPSSFPQYITGAYVDPPGVRLKKEGLTAHHPVVFVPGIVTGGLEFWEGRPCADGLFRKRLWGGSFGEIYKRPLCWVEHMSLDNETGLDPSGIRVRPVSELVAADYFALGYFVWALLIENLAHIGYEGKNMHMAAYDWRLSFQHTEVRDQTLSRLKSTIELMVETNNGRKVVAIPHSMGALYFLHFMKWVEAPAPMGGGGGPDWCAKHIRAVMNIAPPFLGVPKAFTGLFSAEAKDIAVARAIAPGVLDSEIFGLHTLQHVLRMIRTWDSPMSMLPKGGETIWGDLDWSPEEKCDSIPKKTKLNAAHICKEHSSNKSSAKDVDSREKPLVHYGRILSFGKEASEQSSSELTMADYKTGSKCNNSAQHNVSCGDVWTEYHEMSCENFQAVATNRVYTAGTILDLLRSVAPKMMQRADAHFSHGIADNLDDPKYNHYRYWSNPLETKLPDAPEMEIFSLYGVGLPTERSYIYRLSSSETCYIPFRIDGSADGDSNSCLKRGVYLVDGDESVPALSAGFMCAKGWKGKTRFNPSGMATHIREYVHVPRTNLLEGRSMQSATHLDILGNVALIEDIMRVAAGETSKEMGTNKVYSDILKWSERINLQV